MAKIEKDYPITDFDEDWEGHSGGQVQEFLKEKLNVLQQNIGKVPELEQQINDNLNYRESGYIQEDMTTKDYEGSTKAGSPVIDTKQVFTAGDVIGGIWLYMGRLVTTDKPSIYVYHANGKQNIYPIDNVSFDDSFVGWKWFELGTPISILDGDRVAAYKVPTSTINTGERYQYKDGTFASTHGYSFVFTKRVWKEAVTMKERMDEIDDIAEGVKHSLDILFIGNSYSIDCCSYVPWLIKDIYPNFKLNIGIAFRGSCSLEQHLAMATGEDSTEYIFWKYDDGAKAWLSRRANIDEILAYKAWDVVSLQQYSVYSAGSYDEYYKPYINKYIRVLQGKVDYSFKLAINLNHARTQATHDETMDVSQTISDNTKRVIDETACELLMPYGTAIANARTTSLNQFGEEMLGDGVHLCNGIPRYVASCATAIRLLAFAGVEKVSVVGNQLVVDDEFVSQHNVPNVYGSGENPCVGMTLDNMYTAQICAIMANKKPYEIVDMVGDGIVDE